MQPTVPVSDDEFDEAVGEEANLMSREQFTGVCVKVGDRPEHGLTCQGLLTLYSWQDFPEVVVRDHLSALERLLQ